MVVTGTLSFRNSFSNSYGGGAELGAMRGGPGNAAMASSLISNDSKDRFSCAPISQSFVSDVLFIVFDNGYKLKVLPIC